MHKKVTDTTHSTDAHSTRPTTTEPLAAVQHTPIQLRPACKSCTSACSSARSRAHHSINCSRCRCSLGLAPLEGCPVHALARRGTSTDLARNAAPAGCKVLGRLHGLWAHPQVEWRWHLDIWAAVGLMLQQGPAAGLWATRAGMVVAAGIQAHALGHCAAGLLLLQVLHCAGRGCG